jgi:OmcA/MtrC family decaheme c-type cytochrome
MKRKATKFTKCLLSSLAMLAMFLMLYGCSGSDGAPGATGNAGTAGTTGATGAAGGNVKVAEKHGLAAATAVIEEEDGPLATVVITGATADAAGKATVTFTVRNAAGAAVTGLGAFPASFAISSLAPKAGDYSYSKWVPYIYNTTATSNRGVNQGYRERSSAAAANLVEGAPGTYTYTFTKNLSTAAYPFPTGLAAITYDRTRTHRVMVALRYSAGTAAAYHGGATFDFVPAGGAITATRNIVEDATCQKCHKNTPGHYGPFNGIVKACVSCHTPDSKLVNDAVAAGGDGKTNTLEAAVMIHKIHAGRELRSAPGPDGIFFDDPLTAVDESADNGTYSLGGLDTTWRSAAFPAVLDNCVVCHTQAVAGTLAQVDNWKTVPSRAACGSCHDDIDWTTGIGHPAGGNAIQTTDSACAVCHSSTYITTAHNFAAKDIRNIQEFTTTVTTDTPTRGYYIAGESPVVTIVLKDAVTGATIDHTTVVEKATADGCINTANPLVCANAATAGFRAANMYVTGPRALRVPVLTTNARAYVSSATAGPTWDLSAAAISLRVVVDNGNFITKFNHEGEDVLVPGDFTISKPTTVAGLAAFNALFANPAAATATEIAAWLNGSLAIFTYNERTFRLSDRAIAYVGGRLANDAGKVAIRTRGLGSVNPSIQVPDITKGLAGMFTSTTVGVTGSAVQVRTRTAGANADPKLAITAASIKYTLDPVNDLVPGTYMINTEIGIRGNNTGAVAGSYRAYSVAVKTFQVKQAAEEKQIADGCTKCHWSTDTVGQGAGFVLDPVRHYKPFNAQAVDQCGGCHDYTSGETVAGVATALAAGTPGAWTTGGGTKPISKRVHAVHMGAGLKYPVLTVDHEESVWGRNWQITYPMDIRNCESCHSAATSGTWLTNANRLACMGCHDSDAATAHIKSQVVDPTPTALWNGDEKESCTVCH